ncbi:MAG: ABC transporter ATP-binding protein [Rhodobacteraceae bacterium]|nr:ABC transporter ATP-binding protein [Paracoccaceae bacterium]MCY4195525.1 ABC transporter ATP-binding protein [Paracoccaceae bacterium]MCY4326498.1 ABC transporter ATP-binding protein [Paracoccaceae bacterium]
MAHVTAFYGDSQALFDISLKVHAGQLVALMGRNGMGKTTTIRTICGLLNIGSGTIHFDGQDMASRPRHAVARLGIGLVPEGRRCFPNLTVEENLLVASRPGIWTCAKVTDLFPRLGERRDQLAISLSGGEQQMLAIGRALMTNPRLLLLDEATEGLAPVIRHEIWAAITTLKQENNLAILVVDKSLRELREIADYAYILQRGATVWQGDISALNRELTMRHLGV